MSIPKAKSESRFEFTLRLTRALKYAENEGVIRQDHSGFYLDSKTMLDVLYAEVVASDKTAGEACYQVEDDDIEDFSDIEGDEDTAYELTDLGWAEVDASAVEEEFSEFSPSVLEDAEQADDHIQRAPVAERTYATPAEYAYAKSEPLYYVYRPEFKEASRVEVNGHGEWVNCDCDANNEGWNKHYGLVELQLHYEATQTRAFPPLVPFGIGEASAVQKTIGQAFQPCGAVGSNPVSAKRVTSSVEVK